MEGGGDTGQSSTLSSPAKFPFSEVQSGQITSQKGRDLGEVTVNPASSHPVTRNNQTSVSNLKTTGNVSKQQTNITNHS